MVKGIRHHNPPMTLQSSTGVGGTEERGTSVLTIKVRERGGLRKVGHTVMEFY